jgi:hypothetical protein
VPPVSKPAGKQRTDALDDEIQGHAYHNPNQLLRGRHYFKKGQKLFHGETRFLSHNYKRRRISSAYNLSLRRLITKKATARFLLRLQNDQNS